MGNQGSRNSTSGTGSGQATTGGTDPGGNLPASYQTAIETVSILTAPTSEDTNTTGHLYDNYFSPDGQKLFIGLANGILHYWVQILLESIDVVHEVGHCY